MDPEAEKEGIWRVLSEGLGERARAGHVLGMQNMAAVSMVERDGKEKGKGKRRGEMVNKNKLEVPKVWLGK